MEEKLPVYELVAKDLDKQVTGIFAISVVNDPAIEEMAIYMSNKKANVCLAKVDEEKQMIVSPCIIPEKKIFRYDPITNESYYVYFSTQTVQNIAYDYLKNNRNANVTEEHSKEVDGCYLTESWLVENDQDKIITKYGFNVPMGTWCISMKLNSDLAEKLKSQELRGVSIEGMFYEQFKENFSKANAISDEKELEDIVDKILAKLKNEPEKNK